MTLKTQQVVMDYCSAIIERCPELSGASMRILDHSWDSVAVDVNDEVIFKFPKSKVAEDALRAEARLLRYIRPHVDLTVPDMVLFEAPTLFSKHKKIKGDHLEDFAALSDVSKTSTAQALGKFYAHLHELDQATMKRLGAVDLPRWTDVDVMLQHCLDRLPSQLQQYAIGVSAAFLKLPPDPFGMIYGYFDGHGWNMAFDHSNGTLNGIYDFADSGFAPLHQEFVYASLTSPDLAYRIMAAYDTYSGHRLDYNRVNILTAIHRLRELAQTKSNSADIEEKIRQVAVWQLWTEKNFGA